MTTLPAIILVIVALSDAAGTDRRALDASDTLLRIRMEAARQWKAMELETQRMEWEFLQRETDGSPAPENPVSVRRVHGKLLGELFLIQVEPLGTDGELAGSPSVYARNQRYGFLLDRLDENHDEPFWIVRWLGTERGVSTPVDSAQTNFGGMLRLPWSISGIPLRTLFASKAFNISATAARTVDERSCIEVSFTMSSADTADGQTGGLTRGAMLLDPDRRWALLEYSAEYASKLTDIVKLTYRADGPPFLEHVEFQLIKTPGRVDRFDIDVSYYGACRASEYEFTLPAFGLPDYREPLIRKSKFRWAAISFGIGCIFCAWRLRRSKTDMRHSARPTRRHGV